MMMRYLFTTTKKCQCLNISYFAGFYIRRCFLQNTVEQNMCPRFRYFRSFVRAIKLKLLPYSAGERAWSIWQKIQNKTLSVAFLKLKFKRAWPLECRNAVFGRKT